MRPCLSQSLRDPAFVRSLLDVLARQAANQLKLTPEQAQELTEIVKRMRRDPADFARSGRAVFEMINNTAALLFEIQAMKARRPRYFGTSARMNECVAAFSRGELTRSMFYAGTGSNIRRQIMEPSYRLDIEWVEPTEEVRLAIMVNENGPRTSTN